MIREYIYFVDDNPNGTSGMTKEEIIRCGDCKHFYEYEPDAEYDGWCGLDRVTDVNEDDFCSKAERTMSGEVCTDGRFEIIERAKQDLLESTNIDTSPDEMKVLNDFLMRCWQMGWLDMYERRAEK